MACNAKYHAIVKRCRKLVQSLDWEIKVLHCFREANQLVDVLANLGIELTRDFTYFDEPPVHAC